MKRYFIAIILILAIMSWNHARTTEDTVELQTAPINTSNTGLIRPKTALPENTYSLFVPYWNIPDSFSSFNTIPLQMDRFANIIYFGVTATREGVIDTNETGYLHMESFDAMWDNSENTTKTLTLRLTNQGVVDALLSDVTLVKRLAEDFSSLAVQHNYSGVVIDLEYSALATQKTKQQITNTLNVFALNARKHTLSFSVTIYGDVFYRVRPYDLKKIGNIADEVIIMAYDFTKRNQLPGPLFPFQSEGYNFINLLNDITRVVPESKITIAYGLYGYVWQTDRQKRPLKAATAKTYSQFLSYMKSCFPPICRIQKKPPSYELVITKDNGDNTFTILYGESPESIQKKIQASRSFFINKSAIWVYGFY